MGVSQNKEPYALDQIDLDPTGFCIPSKTAKHFMEFLQRMFIGLFELCFFWWCGVYTLAEHAYAMPTR